MIRVFLLAGCLSSLTTALKPCSEWNTTTITTVFGANDSHAGNDESSLDLSTSSLSRDPRNKSIAIVDDNNARILILDLSNLSVYYAILFNTSTTQSNQSSFVTYAQNDSIYILDGWNRQIIKLNSSLEVGDNSSLVFNWAWPTTYLNTNSFIAGFCVDPLDESVFLSDRDQHRIILFTHSAPNGSVYVGNGTAGNAKHQLNSPTSIVMDDRRRLFVNDRGNNRIQVFDFNNRSGQALQQPISNCISLSLIRPNILLVNTDQQIHLFNVDMQYITCAVGCDSTVVQLKRIHNAVFDDQDNLIVSDRHRIVRVPFNPQSQCQADNSSGFSPREKCPAGKFGVGCASSRLICDMSQPCENAGTCFSDASMPYGYNCTCSWGFNGMNCEIDQRPCQPNTCSFRGDCKNSSLNDFECQCHPGFNGTRCGTKINLCREESCENNGVCSSQLVNYTCRCLQGFSGVHCETTDTSQKVRVYVSRSFAYVAILMISLLLGFVVVLDVLKYVFHIDVAAAEQETLRQKQKRVLGIRRAQRPPVIVRYAYIS